MGPQSERHIFLKEKTKAEVIVSRTVWIDGGVTDREIEAFDIFHAERQTTQVRVGYFEARD